MYEHILNLVVTHPYIVYPLIILFALAEGPFLSLTCGALMYAGYFRFFPLYFSLMLGDLIGDVIWYYIGYHYGYRFVNRFGKRFKITELHIRDAQKVFHKYHEWILFISKTTNGFGFAIVVLFTAGLSKISFYRYMLINFLGQMVWSGVLIALGYSFSHAYTQINSVIGRVLLIGGGIIVLAVVISYIRFIKRRIEPTG